MMKKIFVIAICFLTVQSFGQNNFVGTNRIGDTAKLIGVVGIGTEIPVASAKLEIVSTTKGLLIPRMTYAQRNAISSPATGLLVFNTQTNKFNWYTGSAWKVVSDSVIDASTSVSGVVNTTVQAFLGLKNFTSGIIASDGTYAGTFTAGTSAIIANNSSTSTTAVVDGVLLQRSGTYNGAAGNGLSISFLTKDDGGNGVSSGAIKNFISTATNGAETSQWDFTQISAGGGVTGMNIQANGTVRVNNNGDTLAKLSDLRLISHSESTYSPTLTNTTNIAASTAYTTYYKRVGDWVHVWGDVSIDATAATTISEMGMSLPVATAIGNTYELAGTASFEDNTSVQIKGDVTNDRAVFRFTPQSATNNRYSFHFSYKYIAP